MTSLLLFLLFLIAIISALVALRVNDLLAASALLAVFSFVVSLLYLSLGAVDVDAVLVDNMRRRIAQQQHPVSEVNRFLDIVGHEQDGLAGFFPDA